MSGRVPIRKRRKKKSVPMPHIPVDGVDKFAKRWMAYLATRPDDEGTVFSPVGLWPLLAIHADVATDDVRANLVAAISPDSGPTPELQELTESALALIKYIDESAGLAMRAGVWARGIAFRPDFVTSLPAGMADVLSGDLAQDKAALKAWADQVFKGLVSFSPGLSKETTAYLASAVVMSTCWYEQFDRDVKTGRLRRYVVDHETVRSNEEVTTVCIEGDEGGGLLEDVVVPPAGLGRHDVHIVIGKKGEGPSSVLSKGLAAIRGAIEPFYYDDIVDAEELPTAGPGVRICFTDGRPRIYVDLTMPSFHVKTKTKLPLSVCGLPQAPPLGVPRQDFPGMSEWPTSVRAVTQRAFAEFTSRGFTAGALSEMDDLMGCFPSPPVESVVLEINIEGPFGFLAVEPRSGLLLFAGWVTEKEFTTKDP